MKNDSSKRGGSRPGAGRKPGGGLYGEPTTVLRVPDSQAATIRDFLAALNQKRQREAQDNVVELAELAPDSRQMVLPLYSTKVMAGFPSPADDHIERRLNPSDYLVDNDGATFFVGSRVTP